jgi:prolyl 4-hydroxylase
LIDLGKTRGYERSGLVGGVADDGSLASYVGDEIRTSSNTWCTDECIADTVVQDVTSRISNLTGISDPNYEFLQLLQYEPGQFYKAHTDFIDHHLQRQEGVRLLTLFMYLNDVEEGGGTNFPALNLTVTPKQGRAALWPSVMNEDPNQVDERTNHESIPVSQGVKYGMSI